MTRFKKHSFKFSAVAMVCLSALILSAVNAQTPPTPPTVAPTANASAAAPAVPGTPPAAPGALRPMKDFLKDSKATPGFLTLHQKEEKIWIEILPSQLDKPFFFSYNIPRSVGERGLYGSQMGGSKLVEFKKIGNQIQLIAKNTQFFAKE
jgi:hypothetical protein